ncbi:MAG: thermonuclease family protein [Sediminibacterium sp.]|uniref:thermonuclease family protein n=1 Tax=Sediminibacterium sp. TaxID=1917865 RepID=UPI002727E524|nr:thermonuclease family protein [Sediminibacterium sp.]MDO8997662.1 thermonuclease family protein [Sediminibacterium sp.]
MHPKNNSFFLFVIFFLFSFSVQAEEFRAKVVAVSDGDTITVLDSSNRQVKIRLAEIDTPESSQPYGNRAKQQLSDLVFNKTVTVRTDTTDRYGRSIARIYVDDVDVNAMMVELGAAWVYRQYAKDQSLYSLEDKAKKAKVGLWNLPEAERIPPWEWRKVYRKNKSNNDKTLKVESQSDKTEANFSCGTKKYCTQMTSCEEAKFYLKQCGLGRLDRDGDGVPCESICR